MESIKNFFNITITRNTAAIAQAAFGVPLIAVAHNTFSERAVIVSGVDELIDLGFSTSDITYKLAAAVFAQNPKVQKAVLGRLDASVAGVFEVTFSGLIVADNVINGSVNGAPILPIAFDTDDTTTLANLASEIAAKDGIASVVAGANKVTVTFEVGYPGVVGDFVVTGGASQATAVTSTTTAPVVVTDGLNAITDAEQGWYSLILGSTIEQDILQAAAYIESSSSKKIAAFRSSSADVISGATTDVLSVLNGKGYTRSFLTYTSDASEFPDAAILGRMLPVDPGSATYAYKQATGITAEKLTAAQIASVRDTKKGNFFTQAGGVTFFFPGTMASGEFIDTIIGSDWIEARLGEDFLKFFLEVPKVPYTESGVTQLENILRGRLSLAVEAGIISADFVIDRAPVEFVDANEKAARKYTGLSWLAKLQGAVHELDIKGVVSF